MNGYKCDAAVDDDNRHPVVSIREWVSKYSTIHTLFGSMHGTYVLLVHNQTPKQSQ